MLQWFVTFFKFYFIVSGIFTVFSIGWLIRCRDREVPFSWRLGLNLLFLTVLFLLLSPVILFRWLWQELFLPPSGHPFDLIYSQLSFTEGRSPERILHRIYQAGETPGGFKSDHLINVRIFLHQMVEEGYAKEMIFEEDNFLGITSLYYRDNPPPRRRRKINNIFEQFRPAIA